MEMPKLDWKRDVLRSKAVKEMNRQMSFQNYVMYDYKIPSSNNQYIIYFYREHPFGPILSGYLCVLFDGAKRFIIKWTDQHNLSHVRRPCFSDNPAHSSQVIFM